MFARQGEARPRVVESILADARRFPISGGVALRASLSKPSLVLVFVTRSATW